jgi:tetratricopeptide (TPR) repeat protein
MFFMRAIYLRTALLVCTAGGYDIASTTLMGWHMKLASILAAAVLLPVVTSALAGTSLSAHERALYAGDFKKSHTLLRKARDANADPTLRFHLLMQKIRVQQIARLSGRPDPAETASLNALKADAVAMPLALQAQARHVELVSTYFRRLTKVEEGDFMSLQPAFRAAAEAINDPCHKADALFFSALMPQMEGKVEESAAGLEQARATASAAGCELQLSYDLRHLAVVAEEQGDLEKAARLAEESLAIRRRIKFDVFVPYSLLHCADLAQKRGDLKGATAYRREALEIAQRHKLPAQAGAARAALAGSK